MDNNNNIVYNEDVKSSSRLDIVIGLPGSGKSAVIVDDLLIRYGSMILDNDVLLGQYSVLIEQKGGYDYGRRISTSTMGNNGTSREGRRENDSIYDEI